MIEVKHLTKRYGDVLAVDDLSFTIGEGCVYGFLGPNGAGKSTTMNIMTGCLSATAGSVTIDGCDIFSSPKEAKRKIGYLPEQPPLYMNESPVEYLTFVGEAKGLRGEELKREIGRVIALTKIGEVKNRRIAALSKGYKQRVGIAQALLGDPKVIILDEPTVGLDPLQIVEIRDMIRGLGKEHTVIFSSHILSEVQAICDEILMIAHGKLIAFDRPENLEQNLLSANEIHFTTEAKEEEISEILTPMEDVVGYTAEAGENGLVSVTLQVGAADPTKVSRELFFAFAGKKKALLDLTVKKGSLEDLFIELAEDPQEVEAGDPQEAEAGDPQEAEAGDPQETEPEDPQESEPEDSHEEKGEEDAQ